MRAVFAEEPLLVAASDLAAGPLRRLEDDRIRAAAQERMCRREARDAAADHRHPHRALRISPSAWTPACASGWPPVGPTTPPCPSAPPSASPAPPPPSPP